MAVFAVCLACRACHAGEGQAWEDPQDLVDADLLKVRVHPADPAVCLNSWFVLHRRIPLLRVKFSSFAHIGRHDPNSVR